MMKTAVLLQMALLLFVAFTGSRAHRGRRHLDENDETMNQLVEDIATLRSDLNELKQSKEANCQTHYTTFDMDGAGDIRYLDRQNVKCPQREQYMTEWALERGPVGENFSRQDQVRFRIICCNK
uniref:Uncharacterized protein n=1 Tax=Plectus sambesii TaxID=2011161 RepID=A0A914V3Y0_9BILA